MENIELGDQNETLIKQYSSDWIKQLVRNEVEILENSSGDFLEHMDAKKILERATKDFLKELKLEFIDAVDVFNAYRGGSHLPNAIKLFKVSNTVSDFILFRNTVKLIVSNSSLGIINFSFVFRNIAADPTSANVRRENFDLISQQLPFNDVLWTYHGEEVRKSAIVKYMFTEFVKSSVV